MRKTLHTDTPAPGESVTEMQSPKPPRGIAVASDPDWSGFRGFIKRRDEIDQLASALVGRGQLTDAKNGHSADPDPKAPGMASDPRGRTQ